MRTETHMVWCEILACLDAPKYAIFLEVECGARCGDVGGDRKTKGVFRIPDLGPLLDVLLLPKGDRVFVEHVCLYRAQATVTRLIAADCDDDVFCRDGFAVLLDLGAHD